MNNQIKPVGKVFVGEPDSVRAMLLRLPIGSVIVKTEEAWVVRVVGITAHNKSLEKALEGVLYL